MSAIFISNKYMTRINYTKLDVLTNNKIKKPKCKKKLMRNSYLKTN